MNFINRALVSMNMRGKNLRGRVKVETKYH